MMIMMVVMKMKMTIMIDDYDANKNDGGGDNVDYGNSRWPAVKLVGWDKLVANTWQRFLQILSL